MRSLVPFGLLYLVACDSDKSLTVQNPAPTADIISHDDGSEILEGFVITLTGLVSDSNHTPDQLTTTWVVNGETVCENVIPDEGGGTSCDVVFTTDDTDITLQVKDAENKGGSDSITVVILETEEPVAEIITPESTGVYYSDQKIAFEGLVSDAEDDADLLVAYWESDIDGVLSDVDSIPDSAGTVLGYGYLTEGEHAIELHVEDTTGKPDTESVFITVGPPNSAPLCEISSPEDGAAGPEGELVTFGGTVSDVDVPASYLSIEWSSDKDGVLGSSSPDSSGNVSFPFADLTVNTHVISMTVTDEIGAECVANRTYTVGTAPSITIDAPTDGDVINEGAPITFSATVSDAQDQADVVALDWVVDGSSISTQGATSSGEATFSDSSLTYGAYNLVVTATDTDGLTDSDQINFTVNGVPSAPVISINPDPATTSDGLSVSIDSPSVDPEGTIPTYTYEWQLGGQAQMAYTTSTLPSSATNKGEQWTVVVTPNDGITDGASASASITIANTAPILSGLSITPTGTVYNDDVLTCAATVTDPDESPVPTFEWTVGGSVIGSSATLDLSQTGVVPDDVVTCTVTVSDSDGATATDVIIQTVSNRAPTLANTSITPNSGITTDTALTCASTVSDDDGESLTPTYTWTIGTNTYTGDSLQLDSTMSAPGDSITCTVDVADGYGGTATDTASVTVTNTDPVISDVTIGYSGDLTSTTQLACNYSATDADNQTLTPAYTWTNLSTNTQFASTASTLQLTPSIVSPTDVVECSVTVTDTSNGSATLAASETVLNTDPTFITPATVSTNGTQVGDTWTCYAAGTDQDDGTLTPTYEWQDANGTFVASGSSLTLSSSNSAPNTDLTCVATLTDSLNATATSSASATVTNTAPSFDIAASISPNSNVVTASLLTCTGSASDADGDTPTVSYAWSNSNGTVYGSTGNTLQLTPSTVSPADVVTCTLTATDAAGDTATSSASVTVDNTQPTLTAQISATDTSNTGELTCSATASDLDDFPTTPTLTYEWFNSNGSLGTANPLQLDAAMGVDGDTIECTATATDLSGGSATDTATLTITNTAPVIDTISLNPNTIDANTSSVTCVVSSSDADGDTVTESFEWYVDGNLQSETTNMYSGPFIVGTLLACRSTPNDGKTDGDFAEDTATIQNTLPSVDSVTLSPSTVYTNDTITAAAVLSDGDSSQSGSLTATYEWFVDNVSVQNGSSNTLDGVSMFNRDQSVYVTVTPNDGVEDGSPLNSGIIVVSNTAPVMSSVTVTPDPATAGQDDLTCGAVAADADGDAILYTYDWSDSIGNQQTTTEVSDASDVFLASGLTEDTWTCDVTPYDGTDYGASVSGSVTVESGCSSLEFDGVSSFVDMSFSSIPQAPVTYEMWLKSNSFPTGNANSTPISTDNYTWHTEFRGDGLGSGSNQNLRVYTNGDAITSGEFSVDQWHHFAITIDGSGNSTSWLDGQMVYQEYTGYGPATDTVMYLGAEAGNQHFFDGLIRTVRVSNTVRYSSSFTPSFTWSTDSDTFVLWTASGSGTTLDDRSGNGNDGTINGATWVNTCPEEDLDGDGVAAWEDCDDGDANLTNNCTCTATSEMYWLDGTLASDIGVSNWMVADYGCGYGYNHLSASNSDQWCSAYYHDYAGGCSDKKWVVLDCSTTSNGRICEKTGTNNCNGNTYNGNCYKYESHSGDWFDARLACESWGGSLVSIEDSAEHNFVKSLMGSNHYRAWIGLTNFDGADVCNE